MTFNQQVRPENPFPVGAQVLANGKPGKVVMPVHYRGELMGYCYSVRMEESDRTHGYGVDEVVPR